MITKQDFQNIISSTEFFERGLVYVIENQQGEYVQDYNIREKCSSYNEFLDILSVLTKDKHTLKVQGIEFFNKPIYEHCKKLSDHWGVMLIGDIKGKVVLMYILILVKFAFTYVKEANK